MVRRSGRKVHRSSKGSVSSESILHARVGALAAMAQGTNENQVGQSSDDEAPTPEPESEYESEDSEYQQESSEEDEDEKKQKRKMDSKSSGLFGQSSEQYSELLAAGVVTTGEMIMPTPQPQGQAPHHPGFIDDLYTEELPVIPAEHNLLQGGNPQQNSFPHSQNMVMNNPNMYAMGTQGASWNNFQFEQGPAQAPLSLDNFDVRGNYIPPNVQNQPFQPFQPSFEEHNFPATFNQSTQFSDNDLGVNYDANFLDNLGIDFNDGNFANNDSSFVNNDGNFVNNDGNFANNNGNFAINDANFTNNEATFNNNLEFDFGAPLDSDLAFDFNSFLDDNTGLSNQGDFLDLNIDMPGGTDELQNDVTPGLLNSNHGNVNAVVDNKLQVVGGIDNKFTDEQTFNAVDNSVDNSAAVVNEYTGATNNIRPEILSYDDSGSEFNDVDDFAQEDDSVDDSRASSPMVDQPLNTAVNVPARQIIVPSRTEVVQYSQNNNRNNGSAVVATQQVNRGTSEWDFITATQRRVKGLVDAKGCNITQLMMHILHHGTLTFGPTHSNDLVSFVMGRNMCTRAKDIGQNTEPKVPDYVVTWFNSLCDKISESTWEPHLGQFVHPSVPVVHGNPYIDTAPFDVQAALGGVRGRNVDANGQPIRPSSIIDRAGQPKLSSGKFPADINQRGDQSIVSIRHTVYGNPPPREPRLKKIDYNINPYIVVVGGTHETSLAYDIWPNETKNMHRCSVCEFKDTSPKTMQRHIVDHRGWIQCPWNNVTGIHACQTGEMPVAPRLFCRWDKFEEHVNERHPTVGPKFTDKMHPTMFAIYVRHLFRGAQPQPGKLRSSRGRIVLDTEGEDESSAADTSAGDTTLSTDAGDTTEDITDSSILPESPVASATPVARGRKPTGTTPKTPKAPRATKPRATAKSRAKAGSNGNDTEATTDKSAATQDTDASMIESEASFLSDLAKAHKRKHHGGDDEADDANNKKVRAA
ncbi:hypothetical protein BZA77DRAFT_297436 [Pyronema omphalodes]|nr:hypothetical protein BZA77DRAFT_297436 [Pyronema omphalodes]